MTTKLPVCKRDVKTSSAALRQSGHVPGIIYGAKQAATPIAIEQRQLDQLVRSTSESTIVELTGLDASIEVLIKEVTFDPVKPFINHVDLYAFERGKEVTAQVQLQFTGEAPAVKHGAIITKVLHDVEVSARPSQLPEQLPIDLSALVEVDDRITVADIELPTGVTILAAPDEVVAIASEPASEEELESGDVDMSEVAVEEKGKSDS